MIRDYVKFGNRSKGTLNTVITMNYLKSKEVSHTLGSVCIIMSGESIYSR